MTGKQAIDALIEALHDQDFTGYQDEAIREEVATLLTMGAFDPFAPDWQHAPEWACYHTVDNNGKGLWWSGTEIMLGTAFWFTEDDPERYNVRLGKHYDLTGLDWRNSLRARPEVQP